MAWLKGSYSQNFFIILLHNVIVPKRVPPKKVPRFNDPRIKPFTRIQRLVSRRFISYVNGNRDIVLRPEFSKRLLEDSHAWVSLNPKTGELTGFTDNPNQPSVIIKGKTRFEEGAPADLRIHVENFVFVNERWISDSAKKVVEKSLEPFREEP